MNATPRNSQFHFTSPPLKMRFIRTGYCHSMWKNILNYPPHFQPKAYLLSGFTRMINTTVFDLDVWTFWVFNDKYSLKCFWTFSDKYSLNVISFAWTGNMGMGFGPQAGMGMLNNPLLLQNLMQRMPLQMAQTQAQQPLNLQGMFMGGRIL